jgi:glucosamine--fructose-6-phosphate aminotransferase (isomerizing)
VEKRPIAGTIGIGHTRWATHGVPSEVNAHPHATGKVAVVHNGIIENFQELRDELTALGKKFETETDTEVVVHLVTRFLDEGHSPKDAVAATLKQLHGAFALVLIFSGHHDLMIGARLGSPLAIGYGDGEMYFGSDALALAPLTQRICYLEEGDWAVVSNKQATIYDKAGNTVNRRIVETALSGAMIGKGNYRHFMLKEIFEQPTVIGDTMHAMLNPAERTITLPALPIDLATVPRVSISACGTAYYAGLVGKYWIEKLARVPVEIDVASEFRYRNMPMVKGGLAIFISQSGETMDTLSALRYAASQGQHIVSVVNVPESTIARESHGVLRTLAGPEIGVASTKGYATGGGGSRPSGRACRGAEPDGRGARRRSGDRQDRRAAGRGARRALSRPRHELPDRAGRRAEAEGNLLHPCRRLRRRGDEARADRADRRGGAGHRHRARQRSAVRQDCVQRPGSDRPRRPRHLHFRQGRHQAP